MEGIPDYLCKSATCDEAAILVVLNSSRATGSCKGMGVTLIY